MIKKRLTAIATAVVLVFSTLSMTAVSADTSRTVEEHLITYAAPEGVEISTAYKVKARPQGSDDAAWQDVDVYTVSVMSYETRNSAMTYFDCDVPVEVQVEYIGSDDDLDDIENGLNSETAVYPESYNIDLDYEIGGKIINLVVKPGQRVVLDPNGDTRRNIQIWADEPIDIPSVEELKAEGKTVTVVDKSKGDDLQTSYDTDVVYIKPGFYSNGDGFRTSCMKSNQTWYMEGGAVVHGTIDMDFTENAKLIGRGLIYRPNHASMTVNDTVNTYIEGIMGLNHGYVNNGGYFINIANSKNVYVKNIKSIARHRWGDSMDIFCSEDVTVEGCFFRGNDDCIAIYGPRGTGNYWGDTGNVRNIKVKNCVLMPDLARPINFATHGDSASPNGGRIIDNCRFEDIDILTYNKYAWRPENGVMKRMPQPIRMHVSEGNSVTNVYFNNIRIRDYMANEFVELFITVQGGYGTWSFPGKAINNIYFKDIDYKNTDDTFTSRIEGYKTSNGKDGFTQNITFENVKINDKRAESVEDIHANVGNNVKNIVFSKSGETKYQYNPTIVSEDIWPEYYDYARVEGVDVTAVADNTVEGDPMNVLDDDDNTIWSSAVSEQDPVYDYDNNTIAGDGITVDLGEQRLIRCARITWADPSLTHSYGLYASKDGEDWSVGHCDVGGIGMINPSARAERNKRVKSNWFTNQYDPDDPDETHGKDYIIARYLKIIPKIGSKLDIAKLEILGDESPYAGAATFSETDTNQGLMLSNAADIKLLTDAVQSDDGMVNGISNGGEQTIYASKLGQIKNDSGVIEDANTAGLIEVTKGTRSAALQFDLSSANKSDKVIKSAKLRMTPMVAKSGLTQSVSVIENEFTNTENETQIAKFSVPRVDSDNFYDQANLQEITEVSEYPAELSAWQTDIDITGAVISAHEDNLLSLYIAYESGNSGKTEYATSNLAANNRLNSGKVPFLYNGDITDYSKWIYPQLVMEYADSDEYKNAYSDFLTAKAALSNTVVTESQNISAPSVENGSIVTLEASDDTGLVKVENNVISYNSSYVGNANKAGVKITVTNGTASYSTVVDVDVNVIPSYAIAFAADKNPIGAPSVTVGNTVYTDGMAYAREGMNVKVDGGANLGYAADITVTKEADGSEIEVKDGIFVMPPETVRITINYVKQHRYGTSRIAATNSVSIRDNGTLQTPDLVIGANRVTFIKFDLSGYNQDIISDADLSFYLTKANTALNTKAVFYVPNNDWNEKNINKNFCLDGTADTDISNFQYSEGTISLLNGTDVASLIIPDTDDASSAANGILKDYYIGSTGMQKTASFNVTDMIKTLLSMSDDKIITLMLYSAGSGNDASSVNNASTLATRPSLTITESSEYLSDSELITEINTADELAEFAAIVTGGNRYEGKTVTLANDIDLSEICNAQNRISWMPIGTIPDNRGNINAFSGTFDGGNHSITGLYINQNEKTQGLFGAVTGEIKDLTVTGEIVASSTVGGIAAFCSGTITNCHNNVNVTAQREAGGVVGTLSNGGVVTNCHNTGTVRILNKETYVGGIAGHNIMALVENCTNTGKVENGADGFRNRIGGIVGFLDNGEVRSCTNQGEVVSKAEKDMTYTAYRSQNYVGGVIGYGSYANVLDSNSSAMVENAVDHAGGIAGCLQAGCWVSNCTNNGMVKGSSYVGGIAGYDISTVYNCHNSGVVIGEQCVGGIVGYLSRGTVSRSTFENNDGLNAAGYNSNGIITDEEPVEPPVTPTTNCVQYVEGKAKITIKTAGEYTLIFAAYDNSGKLHNVEIQTLQFKVGEQMVTPEEFNTNGAKSVKVMLWNCTNGMKPLCTADYSTIASES